MRSTRIEMLRRQIAPGCVVLHQCDPASRANSVNAPELVDFCLFTGNPLELLVILTSITEIESKMGRDQT